MGPMDTFLANLAYFIYLVRNELEVPENSVSLQGAIEKKQHAAQKSRAYL